MSENKEVFIYTPSRKNSWIVISHPESGPYKHMYVDMFDFRLKLIPGVTYVKTSNDYCKRTRVIRSPNANYYSVVEDVLMAVKKWFKWKGDDIEISEYNLDEFSPKNEK